jgi:hypothetical protein
VALSREDWLDMTRHIQKLLHEADPEAFELLASHVEWRNDPRYYLVDYLQVLIKILSERSGGSHGKILNELNRWIRTEQGGPIRGIRLVLSPADRDLLQREYVDLASLPDRGAIIAELHRLRNDLLSEIERFGSGDDEPRG